MTLRGNIADIFNREIFYGEAEIAGERIKSISRLDAERAGLPYILPGFIDSHVHVESSMLIPTEFARLAVLHGTTGSVSDPHEIANVCGMRGIRFMLDNAAKSPFKFHFGAPSCVPATSFETAGARLDTADVAALLDLPEIYYLSEMMNFPAVLQGDTNVLSKIAAAAERGKPADGHAPGLRGEDAKKYIEAGLTTDHECFTAGEALEKLSLGMKILIREGSAAKNFEALAPLLHDHWQNMMFCSDDKHPDSLLEGHINALCARAVAKNVDVFKVLRAACINPVLHYGMRNGMLREGDAADLVLVKDLRRFEVLETYINGAKVADRGQTLIARVLQEPVNQFNCTRKKPADFGIRARGGGKEASVIEALEGQLITNKLLRPLPQHDGFLLPDLDNDIIKIAVVNRYHDAPPAISFIKNIGLTCGAIASSVAHDSHNIVAAGADDDSICAAVNLVIREQGGISAVTDDREMVLPLPVAGLMSNEDGFTIAADYTRINNFARDENGCTGAAPFMTLSFMALLVIPHLKLSDLGLFDGDSFSLVSKAGDQSPFSENSAA